VFRFASHRWLGIRSAIASVVIAAAFVQPAAASPAILPPTNLRLGNVTATSVELFWNINSFNTSAQVGYGLTGLPGLIVIGTDETTSTSITDLQVGKSYDFKVRSYNVAGCSGWSNIVTAAYGWFKLTVSSSGGGKVTSWPSGINCGLGGTDCSEVYPPGTVVTLSATPRINLLKHIEYDLDHWDGACSGASYECTFTMTDDVSTRAVFVAGTP
jgi:hypothetical protein